MDKPVYFKEYRPQAKRNPARDRLLGIVALALIVGGDILTSIICGG